MNKYGPSLMGGGIESNSIDFDIQRFATVTNPYTIPNLNDDISITGTINANFGLYNLYPADMYHKVVTGTTARGWCSEATADYNTAGSMECIDGTDIVSVYGFILFAAEAVNNVSYQFTNFPSNYNITMELRSDSIMSGKWVTAFIFKGATNNIQYSSSATAMLMLREDTIQMRLSLTI